MGPTKALVTATALLMSATAQADPLTDMAGPWTGSGWARETVEGPREKVRCKLTNTFDKAAFTLTVSGKCVVPGRKLSLAGKLRGKAGSEQVTGRWFNPDGIGSTAINGIRRNSIIAFTFRATDPASGQVMSQNVEWRVEPEMLRLRATDRAQPDVMMSDMTFTR